MGEVEAKEARKSGKKKVGRLSRAEKRPDNLVFAYNLTREREKHRPGRGGAKTFAEEILGIGSYSYYPWESGMRTNPSDGNIKLLCEKLGITREALFKPPENWDAIKWDFYRELFPKEYALVEKSREHEIAAAKQEQPQAIEAAPSAETQDVFNVLAHKQLGGVLDVLSLFSDAAKKLPPTQFETLVKEVTTYIKIKSAQNDA